MLKIREAYATLQSKQQRDSSVVTWMAPQLAHSNLQSWTQL